MSEKDLEKEPYTQEEIVESIANKFIPKIEAQDLSVGTEGRQALKDALYEAFKQGRDAGYDGAEAKYEEKLDFEDPDRNNPAR